MTDTQRLRTRLTLLARSMRGSVIPDDADLSRPQSARNDTVLFGDRTVARKRIVLLAHGCSVATCTMCPLPNEALDPRRREITPADVIRQYDSAFAGDTGESAKPEIITVYTNGNWFVDAEIPAAVRQHIYEDAKKRQVTALVVESLPQFISQNMIDEAKDHLGPVQLVVAIGLQSSDDTVRELAVNTTCTRPGFEHALQLLHDAGYAAQTFLMIKPPFLTEREAIRDTVASIRYAFAHGVTDPILCATRIAPNTIAQMLHDEQQFRPPWLWSVISILRLTASVPGLFPRVVTGELNATANKDSLVASNCPVCNEKVVAAIETFNSTRSMNAFDGLHCACQVDYAREMDLEDTTHGRIPVSSRVEQFLLRHGI